MSMSHKGRNFIYPMMHRFVLYYQASECTWSYQFKWDASIEQLITVKSDVFSLRGRRSKGKGKGNGAPDRVRGRKMKMISMSRAWDKEKIWVPERIRTYNLPNTALFDFYSVDRRGPLAALSLLPEALFRSIPNKSDCDYKLLISIVLKIWGQNRIRPVNPQTGPADRDQKALKKKP